MGLKRRCPLLLVRMLSRLACRLFALLFPACRVAAGVLPAGWTGGPVRPRGLALLLFLALLNAGCPAGGLFCFQHLLRCLLVCWPAAKGKTAFSHCSGRRLRCRLPRVCAGVTCVSSSCQLALRGHAGAAFFGPSSAFFQADSWPSLASVLGSLHVGRLRRRLCRRLGRARLLQS